MLSVSLKNPSISSSSSNNSTSQLQSRGAAPSKARGPMHWPRGKMAWQEGTGVEAGPKINPRLCLSILPSPSPSEKSTQAAASKLLDFPCTASPRGGEATPVAFLSVQCIGAWLGNKKQWQFFLHHLGKWSDWCLKGKRLAGTAKRLDSVCPPRLAIEVPAEVVLDMCPAQQS